MLVSGAVIAIARRGETPRAVLAVLTSFMVQRREARRGTYQVLKEKKNKGKEKKRL